MRMPLTFHALKLVFGDRGGREQHDTVYRDERSL